jgi:hypothetical protein
MPPRRPQFVFNSLELIDEEPVFDNLAQKPAKKRATTGIRRRQPSAAPQQAQGNEGDGNSPDGDGWEWDQPASPAPDAATGGDTGAAGSNFMHRGGIRHPWADAGAVARQQEWDEARPAMQRSYVEELPRMRSCFRAQRLAMQAAMEETLAAVAPSCSVCGSLDMQPMANKPALYVGTEYRFIMSMPCYKCLHEGCSGTFAPSPYCVGCVPATTKSSWHVADYSGQHMARLFDLRTLQLLDTFLYQGGRGVAVKQFAAAVHRQHALNGCSEPQLGFDHFTRQLRQAHLVSKRIIDARRSWFGSPQPSCLLLKFIACCRSMPTSCAP